MKDTLFILFGATGDLANRKLLPTFHKLFEKNSKMKLFGVAGSKKSDEEFREDVKRSLREFGKIKKLNGGFLKNVVYNSVDFKEFEGFKSLKERIETLSNEKTEIIFYLAIPPQLFHTVLSHLQSIGYNKDLENVKVVFEKPFGYNLENARELNESLMKVFCEEQIYRIDHYLGKDEVQNFMVLRFANSLFEPTWNSHYIDNVQITAFEDLGVEHRARYYDNSGALRDMVQNHMMQMLSLIAMEPPVELNSKSIRDEKVKVFSSIKDFDKDSMKDKIIFGQYSKGKIGKKEVIGYLDEPGIRKSSRTETYVAAKFEVDNWRWKGVPFYLRTGKRMNKKGTTIVIEFKNIPSVLYNKNNNLNSNKLIIRIQPDSSINFEFNIKSEENDNSIVPILAEFNHKNFRGLNTPEAYEVLLNEIIKGDQTFFTRWDGVEETWEIIDELLKCKEDSFKLHKYEAGSNGPEEACKLLERDGKKWHNY